MKKEYFYVRMQKHGWLVSLSLDLGNDVESVQAVQEWKQSYYSLRNRVPQVPPNYADEAFVVYKKAFLHDSYYLSITELLLQASLRGVSLVTAIFNDDSLEYRGKSSGTDSSSVLIFVCLRDNGRGRQRGHFERMWPTAEMQHYKQA